MKTVIFRVIFVAAFIALTGCAEIGARVITDATALHEAARAIVRQNHAFRFWVREQCIESVKRDVVKHMMIQDEEKLRQLLVKHYPQLITVSLAKQAMDDPSKISTVPFGCGG